jgi:MFS transporter, ACS family, hexuronate transporter
MVAWGVLALMTIDYVLGIVDRNAVSILKTILKAEFSLTDTDYSLLVTAFLVPYAVFYVVCGRLVDRFGSRATMTAFVGIWSLATVASGFATSFAELVWWRAVLGAAEAGLVPATIFALLAWFPRDRLATVYAIKNPLQALGPIISPPLIAWLAIAYGWRTAFIVPGALGLIFAVMWWFADRNPPSYPTAQNDPDKTSSDDVGVVAVLKSRALWGIIGARLISDPVWFFFQNWQAGYLQERLGWSLADVGRLLWIPPMVTALLMFVVAARSDRFIASGWTPARSRIRILQALAVLSPFIAVLPWVTGTAPVVALLTSTYFMAFIWLAFSNILVADLFPKGQVATAVGVVNAAGTIGAAAFNAGVGVVLDAWGYLPVFVALALLHPAAALFLQRYYARELRPTVPSVRQ